MKSFRVFTCILISITFGFTGHYMAQEQLRPLGSNINLPIIPSPNPDLKRTSKAIVPLDLPFFDDFSYANQSPYPSAKNWTDSSVYVNTGFPIAPISLGVATFDGLNKKGYPYDIKAPDTYSGPADTLTSQAINLKSKANYIYSPADSIFLNFYYQAQGNGDAPETKDSLLVDFYKPSLKKWEKVWGIKGYNPSAKDTGFYRVRIPITNLAYFDSLFQFRFRNKATTSGSLDHWHVDFVQIKKDYFYDDTIPLGVVFAQMPTSFLKNYSVMPYKHYTEALEMGTSFRNFIRNNFNYAVEGTYRYTVRDASNQLIPTDPIVPIPNPGISPFLNSGYFKGFAANPNITIKPFPTTLTSASTFSITHFIQNSTNTDSLLHIQQFTNYFAYDDGTAEQAYYLNQYGAKTAVRFKLNVDDTLNSVRIYFSPTTQGELITKSSFRIYVWGATPSSPGGFIYKDSIIMYPKYLSGSYNLQPTYELSSCLPLPAGTYFIGIQQTTNQPLNIGFDRNTNHKDALFYNNNGTWVQSAIPGSIMINPVMGCSVRTSTTNSVYENKNENLLKFFPNPAQNNLFIIYDVNQFGSSDFEIISAMGEKVYEKSISGNELIDISVLSNGLYFIYLKNKNLTVSPQKLIISR